VYISDLFQPDTHCVRDTVSTVHRVNTLRLWVLGWSLTHTANALKAKSAGNAQSLCCLKHSWVLIVSASESSCHREHNPTCSHHFQLSGLRPLTCSRIRVQKSVP